MYILKCYLGLKMQFSNQMRKKYFNHIIYHKEFKMRFLLTKIVQMTSFILAWIEKVAKLKHQIA